MNTARKIIIPITAIVILTLHSPDQTLAATEKPLLIIPEKLELNGTPGQKIVRKLTVINRGTAPVVMKVLTMDIKSVDATGRIEFEKQNYQSMSNWLIPEYLKIGLNPLQQKEVRIIVSIPENANSGAHNGAILFEPTEGEYAGPQNRFGALVLLNVAGGNGQATISPSVTKYNTPWLASSGPANFEMMLKNSGNSNLKGTIHFSVRDWLGREIFKQDISGALIYPESERNFKWKWGNNLAIGLYRSSAEFTTTGQNEKFGSSDWFIIFPWSILLYALAVLLVLAGIWFKFKVKIRQKAAQTFEQIKGHLSGTRGFGWLKNRFVPPRGADD